MELAPIVGDAILGASADAILAADRDGIIQVWNPGAERIFGYPAHEAVGQSLDLIIPECLRTRHGTATVRLWRPARAAMPTEIFSPCRACERTGSGSRWSSPSCPSEMSTVTSPEWVR
jgi:PAS domain-containing protein